MSGSTRMSAGRYKLHLADHLRESEGKSVPALAGLYGRALDDHRSGPNRDVVKIGMPPVTFIAVMIGMETLEEPSGEAWRELREVFLSIANGGAASGETPLYSRVFDLLSHISDEGALP